MTEASGPPPIIDTHTHLDDPAFNLDRDAVIEASRAAGIRHFVNVGYAPDRWESSRALRERHPDVDLALGLHPQLAEQYETSLERDLKQAVEVLHPVAIGETGFDFSRADSKFRSTGAGFSRSTWRSPPPRACRLSSTSATRRTRS